MNKFISAVALSTCLLGAAQSKAKELPSISMPAIDSVKAAKNHGFTDGPKWARTSMDFSFGTRGVGLVVRYRIGISKWYARFGVSYLPVPFYTKLTLSGYTTNIHLDGQIYGAQLFFEYRFTKDSWYKVIGGLAYFPVAKMTCDMIPTGTYAYGNQTISADQIGQVHGTFDWSGFAPFVGIGIGNPHPKHRIGFAMGLGFYYVQEPTVTVTGTNFLTGNYQNAPYLKDNMTEYRYLPVVNFHLAYRFNKTSK